MASKKLTDFLHELAGDAEMRAKYERNPERVLESSGLTATNRKLLLEGDLGKAKKAVERELGGTGTVACFWITTRTKRPTAGQRTQKPGPQTPGSK